jgi:hypothetical protein
MRDRFDPAGLDLPATLVEDGNTTGCSSLQPPAGRTAIPAAFRYAAPVSRRTPVACWMRRSVHPSRPNAETCCFFSLFKTLAMATRLQCLSPESVSRSSSSLAGFQVTIIGRFWVTTEAHPRCATEPYRKHTPHCRQGKDSLSAPTRHHRSAVAIRSLCAVPQTPPTLPR